MAAVMLLVWIGCFAGVAFSEEQRQEVDGGSSSQSAPYQSLLWPELGVNASSLFLADSGCAKSSLCREPLTTKSKLLSKWDVLNCQCDDECATYGDCCVNAPAYVPEQARLARHHWRCTSLVEYPGLYLLASCPATWGDPRVRSLCERGVLRDEVRSPSDPLAFTPVTNVRSRFTYQNYYCAVCHEDVEGAVFWLLRGECGDLSRYNDTYRNITGDFVREHLHFDDARAQWGIQLPGFTVARDALSGQKSSFVACDVLPQMPPNIDDLVRRCHRRVDDCPPDYANDTVRHLCHSYTAVVFGRVYGDDNYRNVHCALCNGQDPAALSCDGRQLDGRTRNPATFAPSLAFLFDVNEDSGDVVGTRPHCPITDEIYDPFFRMCRPMVCASARYKLRQGRCVLVSGDEPSTTDKSPSSEATPVTVSLTTTLATTSATKPTTQPANVTAHPYESTTSSTSTPATSTGRPKKVASDCPRFNISHLLYRIYANGTVYIKEYDRFYTAEEYVAKDDGSILICVPTLDDTSYLYEHKFSLVLGYLTLACLGISLTCIVFHLLAFLLIPSLRNLSGKNLASLCLALVVAYATFIVSQFDQVVSNEVCTAIAVLLYYSFLASFFWMNCIAFDVWRTLRLATSELRISSGQQWRKFVLYSAYAWLGPAVIVAAAIAVENSPAVPHVFRPSFGKVICWFGSRRSLLIFFVAPVATLVTINVLLFVLSSHIILSTTQPSSVLQSNGRARRNFKLYLRLALIMGLGWIFGIVAGQIDREPLWYVFVVLNGLQGLFIFVSFTCTEKVRASLRDGVLLKKSSSSYYSSSRGQRSTRKFELEGRDSGSGESQSSQTSNLSLSRTTSQLSKTSSGPLY